jgi:hypothetical protein
VGFKSCKNRSAKERENFTTKTFVAKKRHHKYSLLTAGAKKANRQGSLHALNSAAGVGCRQTTSQNQPIGLF